MSFEKAEAEPDMDAVQLTQVTIPVGKAGFIGAKCDKDCGRGGLQPKPFREACSAFWQGGEFIIVDKPQGDQVPRQLDECIPEAPEAMVGEAMRACAEQPELLVACAAETSIGLSRASPPAA